MFMSRSILFHFFLSRFQIIFAKEASSVYTYVHLKDASGLIFGLDAYFGRIQMLLRKLFPVFLGAAMGPLGGFGIVTLIPVLARAWSVGLTTIALSITLYMVPFIFIQVFSGSIAHLFDVKKTVLGGFAGYAAGSILCAFSSDFSVFLAGRMIQGCGAAFLTPVLMAMVGDLVEDRNLWESDGRPRPGIYHRGHDGPPDLRGPRCTVWLAGIFLLSCSALRNKRPALFRLVP